MNSKSIPEFSQRTLCFFILELFVILLAWASIISGKELVMLIAVPLLFINFALFCFFRIVNERSVSNLRQRAITSRCFTLTIFAKICVTVSFFMMTFLVGVSSDYLFDSPGWVIFILIILGMFVCYWLMAFSVADNLTTIRYPTSANALNSVEPEIELER